MILKVCECCGKEFEAKRSDSKTCSSKCRVKLHRSIKKAAKPKVKCEICGKDFTQKHGHQKYCSDECSETARILDQRYTDQKRSARSYDMDEDDPFDY